MQNFIYFLSEINILIDQIHSLDSVSDHLDELKTIVTNRSGGELSLKRSPPAGKSKESPDIICEYRNYCTWSLSLGLIVPVGGGDKSHVLSFNNRRYLFDSQEAMNQFKCNPEKTLLDIVQVLYSRPEIMIFLGRNNELKHFISLQEDKYKQTFYWSSDFSSQTEAKPTHPSRIDSVHEIKLLRKEGFKLANSGNYINNSCQTDPQLYRQKYCSSTQTQQIYEKSIQSVDHLEKGIQTM